MLGMELYLPELAVMLYRYAKGRESESESSMVRALMHCYYDATYQTALAFLQVSDGKRSPREAFEQVAGYAIGLERALEGGDDE